MQKFEIVLMLAVIIPSLFTFSIFFYHPQLHAKVLDFYDIGEINKYNVITIYIQNPTNKTYVLVPIINSHRWYPNIIILKPHEYVIVNVTAPDPTVAISQNSPYVITFYLYNTQTAVLSISGFAPAGTIYPIVNPNFTVIYNSSYGISEYGWQILYNGHITVQKGKIIINGTALIEQALYYPVNGSITVVHDGGEVKACICDNIVVIYAKNTAIFSVILTSSSQ
ncbi:hypothetical membrane protein [Sulfolobus monocaudavirus SMV1]|uniref:hypothetical membrane protein n=1 Tax=Sulfolobus monocaudavirus SMV1 TaxID=1351702 RepID=UPI0003D896A4|nr:hypothetical membrane protein [Sulfolobus monocaudavirus SMV1]CDF81354.1 hypothetical membrane protein [Sulfolobus monocaudavirus SMV1]